MPQSLKRLARSMLSAHSWATPQHFGQETRDATLVANVIICSLEEIQNLLESLGGFVLTLRETNVSRPSTR